VRSFKLSAHAKKRKRILQVTVPWRFIEVDPDEYYNQRRQWTMNMTHSMGTEYLGTRQPMQIWKVVEVLSRSCVVYIYDSPKLNQDRGNGLGLSVNLHS
jgi:hypothetical protein